MFLNINTKKLNPYKVASHKVWNIKNKDTILKLDWNESTIPPSPLVKKAILEYTETGFFNWYPNVDNNVLREKLAGYSGVNVSNIEYFSSSDGLHEYIIRTFLNEDDSILLISPTYDNFRAVAESLGVKTEHFRLNKDEGYSFNIKALMDNISTVKPKALYLCNPNNPTGNSYSKEEIILLSETFSDVLFIVDEAYFEFNGVTVADLVNSFSNILICRTFSKAFGLASMRFGYAISSTENITGLQKVKNPKSVSAIAQISALAALDDLAYVYNYVEEVKKSKVIFISELQKRNIKVLQSTCGNFVFVDFGLNCVDIINDLENNNVFIRYYGHILGAENMVRITVGTIKQMQLFLDILDSILICYND
ncbi:aminotransferase [Photobacterium phosphoreum]|uniref:Aminotransferase n=1 Tax=Photobacterium phosphoreum TaxID=659 RepID=A0A2T3JFU8_PHOPO|nr:histidinol-phosphate transaminase [Photobacterium phosphoreum]PSU19318.1 aminotransferase [Photobacterium phosphoreum]PSU37506.1 aminotransferase [Photobacterium phosphoreum]PSU47800.1 aminotransferase [Photobacterium phosphoreum]